MILTKEPSLPEREEGETAIHFLERIEDMAHRSQIPSVLSKSGNEFLHAVLRSFMRKFAYFGDPLDMAIRKLLMEIDLPKETQQIDRVLQSFADRYHECNPGIFNTSGKCFLLFCEQASLTLCRRGLFHCFLNIDVADRFFQ
jgi:Sec7-like guanine-nucleotide exchange factor